MDTFSLWAFFFFVIVPSIIVYFLARYFVDTAALETELKKDFEEQKYKNVIAHIEKFKPRHISPAASLTVARSYKALSRPDEAISCYQKMLSRLPAANQLRLPALVESGELLFQKNQFNAAEQSLRAALVLQPYNAAANYRLASLLFITKRAQEALTILTMLLTDFPKEVQAIQYEVRALTAEVLAFLGFYEKALNHYEALDAVGKSPLSYFYAKTMKERGRFEKSASAYRRLIVNKREEDRRNMMIIECAEVYYDQENFKEGLLFTEEFLPSLEGKDRALLRYQRALFLEALGDDFIALEEFAALKNELPEIENIGETLGRWSSVLEHPALKRYYTSDTALFEKFIERIIPAGAAVTRRTREFYICTQGINAWVFYRRYFPVSSRVLENIDRSYPSSCFRASLIEILSFGGIEKEANLIRKDYMAVPVSGKDFLSRISSGRPAPALKGAG